MKDIYDDIDELLSDIKSDIEDVLLDEVLEEVRDIEIEHIHNEVYAVYNPMLYQRRKLEDGLCDPDNIIGKIVSNMELEVENIAEFTNWNGTAKRGSGLAEFVNDYDYPGIIDQYRPFLDNTMEEIEKSDRVDSALEKGLIKRKYDIT